MSKIAQWKKILGHAEKEKVQVKVGPRVEELTVTQSYRFNQLSKRWEEEPAPVENPFEQSRYTLAEAAFRMLQSETRILEKAASGSLVVYINASGLQGCWQRETSAGDAARTSPQTLISGYLALTAESCRALLQGPGTTLAVLEYRRPPDPAAADFDASQAAALDAWGTGRKLFCLTEPLYVDRKNVVLMAPLPGSG